MRDILISGVPLPYSQGNQRIPSTPKRLLLAPVVTKKAEKLQLRQTVASKHIGNTTAWHLGAGFKNSGRTLET